MTDSSIVQAIKRAAIEAVRASRPCDYYVGTVVGVNPLEIKISQSMAISEDFLILTRNVTDYKVKVTMEAKDVYHTAHTDPSVTWIDKQEITIHNALKQGEKVLMLRKSGGQEYAVIDRMVADDSEE